MKDILVFDNTNVAMAKQYPHIFSPLWFKERKNVAVKKEDNIEPVALK